VHSLSPIKCRPPWEAEIKKAFKRRALELHPDKGGDADRFRLLQEGFELGGG